MRSVNMHVFLRSRRSIKRSIPNPLKSRQEIGARSLEGPFSPARPRLRDRAVSRAALLGQRTARAGAATAAAGRPRAEGSGSWIALSGAAATSIDIEKAQYGRCIAFLTRGTGFAFAMACDAWPA